MQWGRVTAQWHVVDERTSCFISLSLWLFICDIYRVFAGELPVQRDPGPGLKCSEMIQSFKYRIVKI